MPKRCTKRLEATAYHEAGHAYAAWNLGFKLHRVTIVPTTDETGSTVHANPLHGIELDVDGSDRARMRAEKAILIALAGPAAQQRYRPRSWRRNHGASDFDWATDLALHLCGDGETATAYLKYLDLVARKMVAGPRWPVIAAVADSLLERGTLSGREVRATIMGYFEAEIAKHGPPVYSVEG